MSNLVEPNFEKLRVINVLVINIFSLIKVAANVKLIIYETRVFHIINVDGWLILIIVELHLFVYVIYIETHDK